MNNKEFENIDIPEEIDLFIRNGIKQGTNQKRKKKSNIFKLVTFASVTIFMLISIADNSVADRIPFLNDVFKEIKSSNKYEVINLNINEYFEDYSQIVNQTIKENGISITIENIICDGKYIVVSYIIKNDEKFIIDKTMSQINSNMNAIAYIDDLNYELDSGYEIEGVYTDEYTFAGIQKFSLKSIKSVPQKFDMNIKITSIDNTIGKPWDFDFVVYVNDESNKKIDKNKTIGKFTLNNMEFSPLVTKIDYTLPKETENTFYEMIIKDDNDKEIDHYVGELLEIENKAYERRIDEFGAIEKNCKYIDIIFRELKKVPNPKAPGYILLEKDDLEDLIFRINID